MNTPTHESQTASTHRVLDGHLSYARTPEGQWVVLLRTGGSDHLLGGTDTARMEQPSPVTTKSTAASTC